MTQKTGNVWIGLSLVFAVFLWGGNNAGVKFIVGSWPPIWTGASRFLCAGLVLLLLLRVTPWLGRGHELGPEIRRRLWWQGGLSLAVYIIAFNTALQYTAASKVAVYLGAAPVWALLWEGKPNGYRVAFRRYGAALIALTGVAVLYWPSLRQVDGDWRGDSLALAASLLWTNYGRQCGRFSATLSGAEITAHTMWRAGLLLLPLALVELKRQPLIWTLEVSLIQLYCILAGGVASFALWNHALGRWPASQVFLFNNLIPLSTLSWARLWLGEPVPPTFWIAMILVAAGVILGYAPWAGEECRARPES